MTAPKVTPKVGDRVRVTVEGPVTYVGAMSFDVGNAVTFLPDNATYARDVTVEIVPPPVRVGDVATREVLDALPVGSVIRTGMGSVGKLVTFCGERRWEFAGTDGQYDTARVAYFNDIRVIFIPDPQ